MMRVVLHCTENVIEERCDENMIVLTASLLWNPLAGNISLFRVLWQLAEEVESLIRIDVVSIHTRRGPLTFDSPASMHTAL
jgi:hypothetical protein